MRKFKIGLVFEEGAATATLAIVTKEEMNASR